jgi:hypothetical protein
MKKLIPILLILISLQISVPAQTIKLIPPADKNLHFTLSAGLTSVFYLAAYNYTGSQKLATIISFAAMTVLSFTKEFMDSQFSWGDMAGWGAMVGVITITIRISKSG